MNKNEKKRIPFEDDEWFKEKIMNAEIKKNTKESYIVSMKEIKEICGVSEIHKILRNPKTFGRRIAESEKSTGVKNLYFGIILGYLKHSGYKETYPRLFLRWQEIKSPLAEQVRLKNLSNIPSDRQEEAHVNWEDVIKKRDSLEYGSVEHVLLSMYTYVPPRRQMDYAMLKVYDDKKFNPEMNHNHIHLFNEQRGSAYIFLNEYKTAKFYEDYYDNEIPRELVEIIRSYVSKEKEKKNDNLFVTRSGEGYKNENSFQKFSNSVLKRIFKNDGVTVGTLRHSFDTALMKGEMSYLEKQRLALKMGHSYNQSQQYAFMLAKDGGKNKVDLGNRAECFRREGTDVERIECPGAR